MKTMPDIQHNVALAPLTTIRLGGAAAHYISGDSSDAIQQALRYAAQAGLATHILGGGSNTIFSDDGFDGLVIKNDIRGIEWSDEGDAIHARVGAGEPWDAFVAACIERGLGGVECLSGVPGLVGAVPIQNVGAYGQEVAETIVGVEALDRTSLEAVRFSNAECDFSYRMSRFKAADTERYVITAVLFLLPKEARPRVRYPELIRELGGEERIDALGKGRQALAAVRSHVLAVRKKKSMLAGLSNENARSCGSFFTNPVLSQSDFWALEERWRSHGGSGAVPSFDAGDVVKVPAAWLVEHAGFPKGTQWGNVGTSTDHALALVNRGGSAWELLAYAVRIEQAVREIFGITLEREPVAMGATKRLL